MSAILSKASDDLIALGEQSKVYALPALAIIVDQLNVLIKNGKLSKDSDEYNQIMASVRALKTFLGWVIEL